MQVMRPIREDDLDTLLELAHLTTYGLTTLPRDRELLAGRIAESRQGFAKLTQKPRGESYLFVMEDTEKRKAIGTCAIFSKVGGFEPFYAYRIETSVHHSEMLKVHKEVPTLHLVTDHDGPCEIGSLFLAPDYRKGGLGRMLSLSRFLFMAEHPTLFDPVVIAEMRGVIDEQGKSPFWDAVGSHFFVIDFPTADYLSVVDKRFIAELMPKHPIYIPLLPQAAQEVIGQVHERTVPARKLLESEGFVFCDMVDIFEAGPVLRCKRDEIRTVRECVRATVTGIDEAIAAESPAYLVSNTARDFRACQAKLTVESGNQVRLERVAAEALGVKAGDAVRYVTMKSGERKGAA